MDAPPPERLRLLALVLGLTTGLRQQPTRQELLRGAAASAVLAPVPPARAEEFKDVATVRTTAQALGVDEQDLPRKNQDVKLRTYVDPLFDLTFPKDWFAIRRTIDGDIVRRGGVIFSAGNLRTAEVVTVELFKVKELLASWKVRSSCAVSGANALALAGGCACWGDTCMCMHFALLF